MNSVEFKFRNLLDNATFFIKNAEEDETFHEKCAQCLGEAESVLLSNTRESFTELSSEAIILYVEVSIMSGKRYDQAERALAIFFQRITQEDQFYCRALLAQAQIEEHKIYESDLKGEENLKQIQHAYSYIKKAIEIATRQENKQKYQFLVYNASIRTWHIIRGLMRPGWSKYLVEILEKISNLLEEADDSDFNWRCRYLNALCKSLADADKKPESLKVLDKLNELTKKKGECNFQEDLFRTRMFMYKDNNGVLGTIKKETETGEDKNAFKQLYVIQQIKSGTIPESQVEKELQLLMSTIAPSSVTADSSKQSNQKLSLIMQDRLAECGRIAIKHNFISFAEGAVTVISHCRQGSLRAKIWTEYTKAELLLKKPSSEIDPKTKMKLNTLQKQIEDFERRVEALKILDRVMIANKRLQDPDVTIEGCILIWNTGIPLLKSSTRQHVYKPFQAAAMALEQLEANETLLRVQLHLELAKYEIDQDFLSKATQQLKKALLIDYSQVKKQVGGIEITADDDPNDFIRPLDKTLKFLLKKLNLKSNLYGGDPDSAHELIILDVENAKTTKNTKMRETLLDKAIKQLQEYEEPEFEVKPEDNLVESEIQEAKKLFHLRNIREKKERVLLTAEIASLAQEENLFDHAFEAASICVAEEWNSLKDTDLIIAQSRAHIILAQSYVEFLLDEEIEIGHKDLVTIMDDQDEREFTPEQVSKFQKQKEQFVIHISKAIEFGQQSKQSWLVFNASIEFWNNYLIIFKRHDFYEVILPSGFKVMTECFEAMNNCFVSAQFSNEHIDYDLDKKMQVFSNLSMILARINEFKQENQETVRICDILLTKNLPSHLRKTFDSIKARVTKSVSNIGQQASGGGKAGAKGGKNQPAPEQKDSQGPSKTDILTSEVLSYLELIKAGNKDAIQKALDNMNLWHPNEQEEIELELNVELWCRLGRLALTQETNQMYKTALYCADMAIKNGDEKAKQRKYMQIPVTRLRWYAVAESLYGEALHKLLDTQKQEKESQDKLLHASVEHFVESCNIGAKANISYLVLESAKAMWNAMLGLLDAPNNRKLLVKPMCAVHSHLSAVKEGSDPDFLMLFYSALFQCITEQKQWNLGEKVTEEAFTYVPATHQKVLWEAKMNFLSKLGKNVLSAISNMKENNASLMAKVWIRLARSSSSELEQHSAYNKAIEILRKEESVEVVEVLIEYAEWMHRLKYPLQDVEDQLLLAVDILMDIEPGWDDDDEEIVGEDDEAKTRKTGKTTSSRHSKALSKRTGAAKSNRGGKKSVAGKSKISKASLRSKTIRSNQSRASKKTTTALSKRQEEESQPTFLNCSHYDKLIRIHSMLAMLSTDASKQKEYALDGHFFVMKIWEQSFMALNAATFFDEHTKEIQELGYSQADTASRREYFSEVITNGEINIPIKFTLPDKPEEWTNFSLPGELQQRAQGHEDKIMVAKWTFLKPELTYCHLKNLASILENHYFTIQLLPILKLIELFCNEVLENKILVQSYQLAQSRLMLNLGLKERGLQLKEAADKNEYKLTEEEIKVNYEKIKALKDEKDNLVDKNVEFEQEKARDPWILESIKIHESWLAIAEEYVKWGEFIKAKSFATQANLHARILKDQNSFAKSLLILGTLQYIEGDSAGALRTAMLCQRYAKDMTLIEQSIQQTFNLMLEYGKYDDCERLLDPALRMLVSLRNAQDNKQGSKKDNQSDSTRIVLPLEYAICTTMALKAILCLNQAKNPKLTAEEQEEYMINSFKWADQFEQQISNIGFVQNHIILLLRYCKLLWQEVSDCEVSDVASVNKLKVRLEECAVFFLKIQKHLTSQVYYIGIHQDSAKQTSLSLPILRLLGVTKMRIAQVNTSIGVIKNSIKLGAASSTSERKKLSKIEQTFMDAITQQIDAQQNNYKTQMNRYEKSIAILNSALNMIHPQCEEYSEALVEIAKNRRLLAVNKKHLRGHWRQDAKLVNEINMDQIELEEGQDRKDQLESKGLQGEIKDKLVDYKQEMVRAFVELIGNQAPQHQEEPVPTNPKDKKQQQEQANLNAQQQKQSEEPSTLQKIGSRIGLSSVENVLGTFALEFAEGRANLNTEQAFFNVALYQYSVSRQQLLNTFIECTKESHPDIRRMRGLEVIKENFSYFTSPTLPANHAKQHQELLESSKPMQILHDYYSVDYLKENLPGQTGYLIMQLSHDKQYLYTAYAQINKERKFTYYATKTVLTAEKREELKQLARNLAQNKVTMLKTPITHEEDLEQLAKENENIVSEMMSHLEEYFKDISTELHKIIYPEIKEDKQEEVPQPDPKQKGGASKADKKEAAKKQAPAKASKAKDKGQAELAAYESVLPLTTSGIESLVICADQLFESLPLENLQVFKDVSVVARDFNLHLHMNRLKSVNHKAELHNNSGINKEELKYIIEFPKDQSLDKGKQFVDSELGKLMPGSKWEGVQSATDHIPSEGEWQQLISGASLFAYFSMTCLMHKFPAQMITDLSIFSKCKAMVIFDRLNYYKTQIDRNVLVSKHFSADEQPMKQIALFSLCGVSSIVINHWSTQPGQSFEQFKKVLSSSLGDGLYLGTTGLRQLYNSEDRQKDGEEGVKTKTPSQYKNNVVTFGVPLLRVV